MDLSLIGHWVLTLAGVFALALSVRWQWQHRRTRLPPDATQRQDTEDR